MLIGFMDMLSHRSRKERRRLGNLPWVSKQGVPKPDIKETVMLARLFLTPSAIVDESYLDTHVLPVGLPALALARLAALVHAVLPCLFERP
jgi:hypothetical protein